MGGKKNDEIPPAAAIFLLMFLFSCAPTIQSSTSEVVTDSTSVSVKERDVEVDVPADSSKLQIKSFVKEVQDWQAMHDSASAESMDIC
jgi:hypothetical protein